MPRPVTVALGLVAADVIVGALAIYFEMPRPGLVVAAFNVLVLIVFMLGVIAHDAGRSR